METEIMDEKATGLFITAVAITMIVASISAWVYVVVAVIIGCY